GQLLDHGEVAIGDHALRALAFAEAASRWRGHSPPIFPGEQPARERKIWNEREPLALALRQHAIFRVTVEQAVLVLDAHESRGAGARRPLGIAQLFDGEVRAADLANLAGPHQLVESAERVSDRCFGLGLVELVEVDAIGTETPQA